MLQGVCKNHEKVIIVPVLVIYLCPIVFVLIVIIKIIFSFLNQVLIKQ